MSPRAAAVCESLLTFRLANTTITSAQTGPTANVPNPDLVRNLPSFCRVTATLTPTGDSDITVEVWLPVSGWRVGRHYLLPALATAVAAGYASASTDTGQVGNTAKLVPGHPEKLVDYGYRAVHEMTVVAKAIVNAFYGNPARLSYWNGCSTGGRQGLM